MAPADEDLFERRVGFGECDPARIYFAPRALDYAVEAVEAWHASSLGISWPELARRHGLRVAVTDLRCDYRRPLVAGQVVRIAVEAAEATPDAAACEAIAVLPSGEESFRARLRLRYARREGGEPVSVPEELRARLEQLAARSGARRAGRAEDRAKGPEASEAEPARPSPRDGLPFTRRRRVVGGDADAYGGIYPPRVVEWAVEAIGEWYEGTLGVSWLEQCHHGRGTPFLTIRCEFVTAPEAGEDLKLAVTIPRLGSSSIGYAVAGWSEAGALRFSARMAACHVAQDRSGSKPIPFPDPMRERILAYQRDCRARES